MRTDTIVLSIHPGHIEKILSGEKRYEYRKRIPTDIQYIVVYATAPIKMIVALIKIDSILRGHQKACEKQKTCRCFQRFFHALFYRLSRFLCYQI